MIVPLAVALACACADRGPAIAARVAGRDTRAPERDVTRIDVRAERGQRDPRKETGTEGEWRKRSTTGGENPPGKSEIITPLYTFIYHCL